MGHFAPLDPLEGPVSLLGDAGDVLHSLEQERLLLGVLDVGVDEERIHLCTGESRWERGGWERVRN